jgi:serine/threonine-protein kinase
VNDAQSRLTVALADRYRIEREIGAGGMATVYLAEDLKHHRQVAIKVLRPELAAAIGAERFLAEIRTTANLQHPNILPLFDSGIASLTTHDSRLTDSLTTHDSRLLFYVMPFVEGESLRSRLTREKQLPVADAVRIATEVAGALDYAHRHDVIHRDIKPENILLHDGRALVADFGIALAASRASSTRMTETGMSLGTPHYMSPEQAMGEREITARSDIYALGCVTYEMLVGEPPFTGPTAQAIVAKVMTATPPSIRESRHTVPEAVEEAVHTALEKLPADRFGTAKEFADALAGTGTARHHVLTSSRPDATRPTRPTRLPALLVATAAIAVAGTWAALRGKETTRPSPPARLVIPLAADRLLALDARPFDISPDGTAIAYVGDVDGQSQLFLRPLDDFEAHPIPGTEGAHQPFFSPDGKWIGFVADGKLKKIPLSGGAPIALTSMTTGLRGASWGADGTILYSYGDSLFLIPDQGGTPTSIHLASQARADTAPANNSVRWPQFLPDGRHALISTDTAVEIVDLTNGEMRPVVRGRQAIYLADGHLLFDEAEGRMRVVPFDLRQMAITGSPVPAFEAFRGPGTGSTQYAVSRNGTLVYVSGGFNRTLVMVDRNGREAPLALPRRGYRYPRFSPDGERLAVTIDPRPSQIWVVDLRHLSAVPVTTEGHNLGAVWSPDGSRLVFATGGGPLWVSWPEGVRQRAVEARLHEGAGIYPGDWMARTGIIATSQDSSGMHLVSFHLGDSILTRVTGGPAREWQPSASPDERWVAFSSNVSGADEVYVRPLTGVGEAIRVSTNGGGDPIWGADGKSLYYRRGSRIMMADVATKGAFQVVGAPRELLAGTWDFSQQNNWDVAPDGRFIMVRGDPAASGRLLVVLNWFDALK